MAKPAKLPTIQDLSRDELLHLVSIAWPNIEHALLLKVQASVAQRADLAAGDAAVEAINRYQSACEQLKASKPGSVAASKANRACKAAYEAWEAAAAKSDRVHKRWKRLRAQLTALEG
jgi:hypothetical protein